MSYGLHRGQFRRVQSVIQWYRDKCLKNMFNMLFCWQPNGGDGFSRLMIKRRLVISDHSVINRFQEIGIFVFARSSFQLNCCFLVASRFWGQWSGQKSRCSASICSTTSPTNNSFKEKCKSNFEKHDISLKLQHLDKLEV